MKHKITRKKFKLKMFDLKAFILKKKFFYASSYIKLDKFSNLKIKLMNNATCTSKDLIYIIICKKCKQYYMLVRLV